MVACETHEIEVLTDLSEGTEGRPWIIYQCVKYNENFQKFNFKVRLENNETVIIPKIKEESLAFRSEHTNYF